MRIAVVTNKPGSVEAKYYRQILHGNIVQHRVIRSLQKGRINRNNRVQPRRCHTCGKSYCVLFGNAYIEKSVRVSIGKIIQACTVRHGCRNGNNFFIVFGKLHQRFAKNFGITHRRIRVGNFFAGFYFKRTGTVKFIRAFFRRFISLAFFGNNMNDNRAGSLFSGFKNFHKMFQIMPVNRAIVFKAQMFKNRTRHKQIFNAAFNAADNIYNIFAVVFMFKPAFQILFYAGICFCRAQLVQIIAHSADVFGDRHLIVIKHNNQLFLQIAGVVQRFISHATCHGAVADNGNHFIIFALQVTRNRHAQSSRYRSAGMPCSKCIVLAFLNFRKAGNSVILTQRFKGFAPPGNYFVNV